MAQPCSIQFQLLLNNNTCMFRLTIYSIIIATVSCTCLNWVHLLSFSDILVRNGIDMPDDEFYDLMTKYDLREDGSFAYVDFLRHFILNLKPQDDGNLLSRRRVPQGRVSVSIINCLHVLAQQYLMFEPWRKINMYKFDSNFCFDVEFDNCTIVPCYLFDR